MGIPRKQKPSPAAGEFLFELDPEPLEEDVTAYAGIPLFVPHGASHAGKLRPTSRHCTTNSRIRD
jgi:hypothetical protein